MAPKTPDLDALLKANRKRNPGGKCSVGAALAQMDPATRAKIEAAIDDEIRFAANGIAAVLRELGYDVARSSVGRHRIRECKCR